MYDPETASVEQVNLFPVPSAAALEHARSAHYALESAREADVLREHRSAELRLITEAGPACTHEHITVHRSAGSTFDDHETVWGQCDDCDEWVVSTLEFGGGGHLETRPMTENERARYDRAAIRDERSAWLDDYRAGAR